LLLNFSDLSYFLSQLKTINFYLFISFLYSTLKNIHYFLNIIQKSKYYPKILNMLI